MSTFFYNDDDCALVSAGCVLPQAVGPNAFWNNIKQNKSAIGPMSSTRQKNHHYSPYRELDDKSYSNWGAEISQEIFSELREVHNLEKLKHSQLDVMTVEAVTQALKGIKLPADRKRIGLVLGIMNPDELLFANLYETKRHAIKAQILANVPEDKRTEVSKIIDHYTDEALENFEPQLEMLMTTSTLEKVRRLFDIQGPTFTVDAACASSLASIDICMKKLKNREIDVAIAGGSESNLSPGAFVLFSKVGALAVERCLPFDSRSDGLSQGEGSVVFVLKRLTDAKRDGDNILGVIRSCASSSDGRVASLFQPSLGGQILAYTLAYRNFETNRVDYIELHGTGTKIGDQSEAQSLSAFFKDYVIPVGSIKSLVGHTKSTAGATGLLKSLLMMREKTILPSPYVQDSVLPSNTKLFVNTNAIKLEDRDTPYRIGVSSFGFGGCNYHLVVDSYKEKIEMKTPTPLPKQTLVLVGQAHRDMDDFDPKWFTSKESFYRLPPRSLPQIDRVQLLAVKTTEDALENAGLSLTRLNPERVAVISASTIGLDILQHMSMRISLDSMAESALSDRTKGQFKPEDLETLAKTFLKIKDEYDPVTEDSGPGILNNVIAGRVCNAFNFRGKNLNIDCDTASIAAALDMIETDAQTSPDDIYVLIGVHEDVSATDRRIVRKRVSCYLLTTAANARAEMFPIEKSLTFTRGQNGI
jgi:acyl transferase domain-containing protein